MFQDLIDALIDIVLFVPRWLYAQIVDVVLLFLSWIPEIDIADVSGSGFGSDILYFTTIMEVPYGLTAVSTALFARFVLRRIPFIG